MKVNIQYSIELNEIPDKIREFLMHSAEKSQSIEAGIRYTISLMDDDKSIDEQLKRIDLVRRELADIDLTLLDCTEILHGYQKALVQLREPQETQMGNQNLEVHSDQLKELQNSLKQLVRGNHDDETRDEETEER